MANEQDLLQQIEEGLVAHGGDLGGWTQLADEQLKVFDGRITLRAEIYPSDAGREGVVHGHVFATLHEHNDEVLDACLFGLGENREQAIAQCAMYWITCVAGPIRSFLDNKPVCMTCQAGVKDGDPDEGYMPDDYGFPGLRAYVGPAILRNLPDDAPELLDADQPWFRFAAESAAPRSVHIAKSTVTYSPEEGWTRSLEIDGHEVSHNDKWVCGQRLEDFGYSTRWAVFEFPANSSYIKDRAELDRAIRHFLTRYPEHEEIDALIAEMEAAFDPDLVKEVEAISSLAFGRLFFEQHGLVYPEDVIRARRDGRVETVPLMSIPAYSRGRAVAAKLAETMSQDDLFNVAAYSAESNGILQILEEHEDIDLSSISLYPCVAPERNISDETFDKAMAQLHDLVEASKHEQARGQGGKGGGGKQKSKPWWKIW